MYHTTPAAIGRRALRRARAILAFTCFGFLAASAGCTPLRTLYPNALTSDRLPHGYVIILPGMEGAHFAHGAIARGLEHGGVRAPIEIYDWTTGLPPLALVHLRSQELQRYQAQILATRVVEYQQRFPGRPVYLVGHSTGGAMCLRAMEALPAESRVTAAFLLAPSISSTYDIEPALGHADRGLWCYHSLVDYPLCGLGTTVFGTADGVYGPAAGAVGFRKLPVDPAARERVHQSAYTYDMLSQLNWGGHYGWTTFPWAKQTLAPMLVDDMPEALPPAKIAVLPFASRLLAAQEN